MDAGAAGVDDAFGDAFVIEVCDFFAKDEVFEERRPVGIGSKRVLIVGEGYTLIRGQVRMLSAGR